MTKDQLLNAIAHKEHKMYFNQLTDMYDRARILEKAVEQLLDMKYKQTDIYSMDLHSQLQLDNIFVTRVPGGWIYETPDDDGKWSSVYVPFDNDFQTK